MLLSRRLSPLIGAETSLIRVSEFLGLALWVKQKRKRLTNKGWALNGGGDEEDRTPDLRIANATLSQLSYVPTVHHRDAVTATDPAA